MRKFNVNVNGKAYYVEIEEAGGETAVPVTTAPKAAPAPVAPVKTVETVGGTAVVAPMPGQILDFSVAEGASVKKGDKVIILEAMKMENEIVASADGVIHFLVKKGDSVDSGAKLATIK